MAKYKGSIKNCIRCGKECIILDKLEGLCIDCNNLSQEKQAAGDRGKA